jgi:2-polyprenyl-3-methyl-5-hydroxy-6-metoxy-1,4-benzoquinol methylase
MHKISKNTKTEKTLLSISKIPSDSGIADCVILENTKIISKIPIKGKIIEFGCGIFPLSFGISNKNISKNYLATDISKDIIKKAKKIDNRLTYKIIDLDNIQKYYFKKKYDLVIFKGVLHHLQNPKKTLNFLKKILKKKSYLVISEPNSSSIVANALKFILSLFKINLEDSPFGQLSQNKIHNMIKINNFIIEKKWYTSFFAFIVSGDYGRIKILPNNKIVFKIIIILDKFIDKILNFTLITKFTHFKVNYLIKLK